MEKTIDGKLWNPVLTLLAWAIPSSHDASLALLASNSVRSRWISPLALEKAEDDISGDAGAPPPPPPVTVVVAFVRGDMEL